MTTRLITFLGTGPRHVVQYKFEGRSADPTPAVAVALCQLFPDTRSVCALGTDRAIQERAELADVPFLLSEAATALRKTLGLSPAVVVWRIPNGSKPEELWQIFDAVRVALEAPVIETEEQTPTQIVLDVTHGFRAQQIIAVAALSYVQSENQRKRSEGQPVFRLLYGAVEMPIPAPPAPAAGELWDLLPFTEAHQWNTALDSFERFGRADALVSLLNQTHQRATQEALAANARPPAIKGLADRLGELADSLVTTRLSALLVGRKGVSLARQVRESLERLQPVLVHRVSPIRGTLGRVMARLDGLSAPGLATREGVEAALKLADWYLDMERYAELAVLLRETLVTSYALAHGEAGCQEPGEKFDDAGRRTTERTMSGAKRTELAGTLLDIRNDSMHGGYRKRPLPAQSLREQLSALVPRVAAACRELLADGHRAAQQPSAGCFANVSNHPSEKWSVAQRAAALALGAALVDVPFPDVPPEADAEWVSERCREVVSPLLERRPAAACVQGEFTLTLAIVRQLQIAGVRCVAATTRREAVEQRTDQGTTKTSRFEFVQWRDYPTLA